jgi:hypothetical protein
MLIWSRIWIQLKIFMRIRIGTRIRIQIRGVGQPKMGIPPGKTLGTPLPVTFINININTVPQPDPHPKTNPDAVGQKIKLRDILYNTSVLAQSELNFLHHASTDTE